MLKEKKTAPVPESSSQGTQGAANAPLEYAELSGAEAFFRKAAENKLFRCFAAAAAAYLLCGGRIGGAHSPLCVPLAAVLDAYGTAAVLGGMLLRCIIGAWTENYIPEIASVVIMLLVKLISGHSFSVKGGVVLSACTYAPAGGFMLAMAGFDMITAAAVLFRTIICIAGAYIFGRALSGSPQSDPVPAVICGMIGISALCSIQIGYFNPGRTAVCLAAAVCAGRSGCKGGAAGAAAGAMGLVMADSSFCRSAALAVCSAFISGLAVCKGKQTVSVTFIFSALFMAITVGLPSGVTGFIVDSALAGVLCFALPDRLTDLAACICGNDTREDPRHFSSRLSFASAVTEEISSDIIAARRIASGKEQEHDYTSAVYGKVCSKCRLSFREEGEEADGEDDAAKYGCTADMLIPAGIVRRKGVLRENDLPTDFSRCPRKAEIVRCFNREYKAELRRAGNDRIAESICGAALEQLTAHRLSLESLAYPGLRRDPRLSERGADIIRDSGYIPESAAVYYDRAGRIYAEAFIKGEVNEALTEVTLRLSDAVGQELDIPVISEADNGSGITRCRWCRLPEFIADVGISSQAGSKEQSGDTADSFSDGFGNMYFIIADGMGSGLRAAQESVMAVSVIRRFIRSGAGTEAAVHYVNLLLSGVFSDEMFTTLDILELNTFTGRCVFYKLGAPESFLRCGDTVTEARCSSLPVGMLPETVISPVYAQLRPGDCAVMISDGIGEECRDYIREIMMNDTIPARVCADRILSGSSTCSHSDDKTVLAVKLYSY